MLREVRKVIGNCQKYTGGCVPREYRKKLLDKLEITKVSLREA